jgi:hypothetical protein
VYLYLIAGIGRWFMVNVFVAIVCIGSMDMDRKADAARATREDAEAAAAAAQEGGDGDQDTRLAAARARAQGAEGGMSEEGVPFTVFGLMLGSERRPTVRAVCAHAGGAGLYTRS